MLGGVVRMLVLPCQIIIGVLHALPEIFIYYIRSFIYYFHSTYIYVIVEL